MISSIVGFPVSLHESKTHKAIYRSIQYQDSKETRRERRKKGPSSVQLSGKYLRVFKIFFTGFRTFLIVLVWRINVSTPKALMSTYKFSLITSLQTFLLVLIHVLVAETHILEKLQS